MRRRTMREDRSGDEASILQKVVDDGEEEFRIGIK